MAEDLKKPVTTFKELPDPIRGWLASSQITYLISDLNRRLGFREEEKMRVVPTLILRLAISNIDPEKFISELSNLLDISPSAAKALAQEIEEKMLRPIELVLRNELGIDIKLIHLGGEAPIAAPSQQTATTSAPAQDEKLIASPEVAHPEEARPVAPPIYRPQPQAPSQVSTMPPRPFVLPMPKPAEPIRPPMNAAPVMPRVEPLPSRPAPVPPPIPPRPAASSNNMPATPADQKPTPVPIKVMPSRVPNFLNPEDFK